VCVCRHGTTAKENVIKDKDDLDDVDDFFASSDEEVDYEQDEVELQSIVSNQPHDNDDADNKEHDDSNSNTEVEHKTITMTSSGSTAAVTTPTGVSAASMSVAESSIDFVDESCQIESDVGISDTPNAVTPLTAPRSRASMPSRASSVGVDGSIIGNDGDDGDDGDDDDNNNNGQSQLMFDNDVSQYDASPTLPTPSPPRWSAKAARRHGLSIDEQHFESTPTSSIAMQARQQQQQQQQHYTASLAAASVDDDVFVSPSPVIRHSRSRNMSMGSDATGIFTPEPPPALDAADEAFLQSKGIPPCYRDSDESPVSVIDDSSRYIPPDSDEEESDDDSDVDETVDPYDLSKLVGSDDEGDDDDDDGDDDDNKLKRGRKRRRDSLTPIVDPVSGKRRRTRIKPLEFWKLERVVYGKRPSGMLASPETN
jgi:hypothetical protein